MSLFSELRRRNVVRVAVGYLAGAWLLIQIVETLFPIFGLAQTAIRVVVILLAVAFVPVLVLSWVFEWTPEGLRRDEGQAGAEVDADSRRRFDRIILTVLALAVSYFAVDKFVLEPGRRAEVAREARREGRVEAVLEQYRNKSIVVLPFANLSADPDQEYFADGLSEELLNLLAQMPELRVISRSTAFTFKGKDVLVPDVAKRLNVSHVLEGSVRKAGNRIRITAQLIDARTDTHLWSETYDRELEDIFAIQDDISATVVAQLELELLGEIPRATPIDPRAYELYLQAHHIIEGDIIGNLDAAEAKLEEALVLEPDFLAALADLGRVYEWSPRYAGAVAEQRSRIREVVARMAEIAPGSSYTNAWQGYIARNWNGDHQAAARHYERAIADDPFNPEPLLRIVSGLLVDLGRLEEAEAVARFDLSRDPACVNCVNALARALRRAGRHREAAEELEKILAWQGSSAPLYWNIGAAWLVAGEPERALGYFDRLRAVDRDFGDMARTLALHDLGRREEFEAGLARALAREPVQPESIARIYAWAGQTDEAFEWLDRTVEESGAAVAAMVQVEWYDKLHSDPRWQALLQEHGVTDEDLSQVEFDPPWPPEVEAAIARYAPQHP